MERKEFCRRLSELRMKKGVSSRDMSLSLGLSASYINNIENDVTMPSMDAFFLICDYFDITPKDFFDVENDSSLSVSNLISEASSLTEHQIELIIQLIKEIKITDHN